MDLHFLKQITEIRIGLEGIAGEYAAKRVTNEQLVELELILGKVAAIENSDMSNMEELLTYESAFHDVIYASTGNLQLEKLLHNYQSIGARFWHYLVFSREQMADQFESYRKMFEALKKGDENLCRAICDTHIRQYIGLIDGRIDSLQL